VALGLAADDPMHDRDTVRALANFEAQVALAVARGADMVVHTGDLLNLPSAETVAWVAGVVRRSGLPFRFVCGNHDWCYEGLGGDRRSMQSEAGRQAVRSEWREKRLRPLFGAFEPSHWSEDVAGLRLIALDNSTCRVSAAQLAFFEERAAGALPVVLLLHVPLHTPALKASLEAIGCGAVEGEAGVMMGYLCGDEAGLRGGSRPEAFAGTTPDADTLAFVRAVRRCPRLAAVLSGHLHSHQVHPLGEASGALQLVTEAGLNGGWRLLEFGPSTAAVEARL
jgi:hypothetical protein